MDIPEKKINVGLILIIISLIGLVLMFFISFLGFIISLLLFVLSIIKFIDDDKLYYIVFAISLISISLYGANTYNIITKNSTYKNYEKSFINEVKYQVSLGRYNLPIENANIIITNYGLSLITEKKYLDNSCDGYVIIKNNKNKYKYEAYIKCNDDYITNGYNEENNIRK